MRRLASALFVDFDNLYLSMNSRAPMAAQAFGTSPQVWLDWLQDVVETPGFPDNEMKERTFLIRRCYASPRAIQYFRPYYARNAFQVIECPPMTRGGKNTADIHMVMDVLDTMAAYPHIEEFVIFSSDSDFTPVITRLRAHGKRTVIYSTEMTAAAYKAACDDMVIEHDFVEMLLEHAASSGAVPMGEQNPMRPRNGPRPQPPVRRVVEPEAQPVMPSVAQVNEGNLAQEICEFVRGSVIGQDGPVALKDLVEDMKQRFGERIEASRWAGAGSVTQFLRRSQIEGLGICVRAPAFVYDAARYTPADMAEVSPPVIAGVDAALAALIVRINTLTNVPDLSPALYARTFEAIAADLRERPYALWQTAKSARDRLLTQGYDVHHRMIFFILRGIEFSRHRFSASDTAESLANQFRRQVSYLCRTASLSISDEEQAMLGRWITHDPDAVPVREETGLADAGVAETLEDVLPAPASAPMDAAVSPVETEADPILDLYRMLESYKGEGQGQEPDKDTH